MNKDIKKMIGVAEKLDWSVTVNDNDFEFEKYSPAGQDFILSITANNLEEAISKIRERYDNFDVSEEASLWLDDTGHGKNGAPYDMKDLYEDMEACEQMILELYEALTEIEE